MSQHTDLPLAGASTGCQCGHDHDALPELDARTIPHAIRHGAIIGAAQQLQPGQAFALVAPHDPQPLLAQLHQLFGDQLAVDYLQRGPEAWKLKLTRA